MKQVRILLIFFCLFGASACTVGDPSLQLPVEGEAARLWQVFGNTAFLAPEPAVLDGSLRFGPENDTTRVTYTMWSNGSAPLRLDIQAGAGVVAARVQVANNAILIFSPQDGNAYLGKDSEEQALNILGLPLPLSVEQLSMFLLGNYATALGQPAVQGCSAQADGYEYAIVRNGVKSTLRLDALGRPLTWIIPQMWRVTVAYDENSGLPRRIDASRLDDDYAVVLLIRNRQSVPAFAKADLNLVLPLEAKLYSLD